MILNSRLIDANTQFSLKLLLEIAQQNSSKNIFVSPYCLAVALAMTYNGATGETHEAMAKALELQGINLEEVNQANAVLRETLKNLEPNLQLYIANSLWTKEEIAFHPEFVQLNKKFYQAKLQELNFNDPKAPSIINNWIKQSTNGKIDKIIDQIEPNSILFLINAAYFKGNWSTPFPQTATKDHPFTLLDGTQKQHPMMFQSGNYQYQHNDTFQAISLAYGEGRFSMYIFLPNNEVDLNGFYEKLNADNWEKWMNQFALQQGSIGLPRFKFEYSIELNDALKALGMEIAFDCESADFSGMRPIPPNLCINKIKHKTFIEVNEEGTEASAATAVEMVVKSFMPEKEFNMVVDHPFFCTIQDNQTGTILFMGSIVDLE